MDLDAASDCVSPFTDAESRDGSSGYFSDDYQFRASPLRDDADENDDEDDDTGVQQLVCEEDKAMLMMLLKSPSTGGGGGGAMICGEEWINWTALCPCGGGGGAMICGEERINWTALCPCCRRDASDDSIDLQEMIKLEPIRVSNNNSAYYRN